MVKVKTSRKITSKEIAQLMVRAKISQIAPKEIAQAKRDTARLKCCGCGCSHADAAKMGSDMLQFSDDDGKKTITLCGACFNKDVNTDSKRKKFFNQFK